MRQSHMMAQRESEWAYVDMGTLNWSYFSSFNCFNAYFSQGKAWLDTYSTPYLLLDGYKTISYSTMGNPSLREDMCISQNVNTTPYLLVTDYSFNGDAAAFKSAMSGKYLFYKRVKTAGNIWDEQWENGLIGSRGVVGTGTRVVSKNYIPVEAGATYLFKNDSGKSGKGRYAIYDSSYNCIYYSNDGPAVNGNFTIPEGGAYMKFCTSNAYGSTYTFDLAIVKVTSA